MSYYFSNVDHALKWATEVLRLRQFPRTHTAYMAEPETRAEAETCLKTWMEDAAHLPQEAEERTLLAMHVYRCVDALPMKEQELVRLRYWGDYATSAQLKKARSVQEHWRRKGKRVRLSYRYSYRQMATVVGSEHKNVRRKLMQALDKLEKQLQDKDLILTIATIDGSDNYSADNNCWL